MTNTWPESQTVALRKLFAAGLSFSQIAAEIGNGVTRNAVIGKALRIGLPTRKLIERRPPSRTSLPPVAERKELADDQIPQEQRCSIFELTDRTCRWPIGDPHDREFFFCGGSTEVGSPYCHTHLRRSYRASTG